LRQLAHSLSPQKVSLAQNFNSEAAVQLSEDLLALVRNADEITQRATQLDCLPECKRIGIICLVSRLRLVITTLATEIHPGVGTARFLDFPIEC
jgi:hypothetical protein